MLATTALAARPFVAIRCHACRYFTLERCCNASARLEGQDDRDGECPHFRFGLSSGPAPEWQVR
ncbi:hypothetical protein H261_10199 [Paramagnetospirillum caucaseum]|uniref:Uncharacterized protein n=1 Tax=Paramagnetospirillum caucaseum TaxID=1244869 RepID=M2Z6V7_9PROT|nr:hypothetical protein [Paramagnetospirillum caucaseum]EME70045.1 hypothetical protein H261_10199 [Paramagnetospirillum caucaseum]